jgi:hypothetical protein
MKTVWTLASALLLGSVRQAVSVTIPAGTILTVATLQTVSSIDAPGTPVPAQLMEPVRLNGKVVLPTGSYFNGKIITSRRLIRSSDRLTVNLTAVRLGGRDIAITTTGPRLLANNFRASGDVKVSRAWDTIAAGKRLQFQLARSVVLQ